MQEVVLAMSVVSENVVDGIAVFADGHSLKTESVLHETLVHFLAENHLFAMHQVDGTIGASFAVGDEVVNAVVENHTVLQDFHNRTTLVLGSSHHHFLTHLGVYVDGASEESATSAEYEFGRHEWVLGSAIRR